MSHDLVIRPFKRKEAAEANQSGTTPERTELDNVMELLPWKSQQRRNNKKMVTIRERR